MSTPKYLNQNEYVKTSYLLSDVYICMTLTPLKLQNVESTLTGPSQGLKIRRGGARSTVVGIISLWFRWG